MPSPARLTALPAIVCLLLAASAPAPAARAPRAIAPAAGLDAAVLRPTLARAAELPRLRSLIVAQQGRPVVERVFRGPGLDTPVNVKSASKTLLSAIAGAAIADGVLTGVDQRVAPLLGERVPGDADPRVRAITVEHLLAMRTGLESTSGANYGRWAASPDWVRFALSRPFVDEPGGTMIYSTGTSHILSAALTQASGRSTLELARAYLGRPLGIEIPAWSRDRQGTYFGGNEMALSPRALVTIGELYRNGGVHRGRRVLPASWVRDSWRPQGVSAWSGMRYGYGWWIAQVGRHPVYFAWGYGGQMLYVVPSLALTVVMTSDADGPRDGGHVASLHALLVDGIIPAAERGRVARVG